MTVQWEEPPARSGKEGWAWMTVLTPLMERPGEWARLREYSSGGPASNAQRNLRARMVTMPPGSWEFVSRRVGDTWAVFGRYMGPNGSET